MHMATKLKRWTLEELHSLPDDGNKYELIRGELFVTPPLPLLVVEVFSPTTRRRDQVQKHDFYMDAEIPEHWMVDPDRRVVTVGRPGEDGTTVSDTLVWHPAQASDPLTIPLTEVFGPS